MICVAHNALFEQVITKNVLSRQFEPYVANALKNIPPARWLCTAALAAPLALPRKLEKVCPVLKLPHQKNMDGHRLMLKMSKPRKPSKKNPSTRHTKKDDLRKLLRYCIDDIKAETELFLALPHLLPLERKLWELDQTVNLRGVKLDRKAIHAVLRMVKSEIARLNQRTHEITDGEIETTNKLKKVKTWLEKQGVHLPNMQAKTIEDALDQGLVSGKAKEILEIRQSASLVSIAKYDAFECRSRFDSTLRDFRVWHGASTGRDTGTGAQMHNLPRGTIKDAWDAVELIRYGDADFLRMIYGDPLQLFSNCIRSMIIPRPGNTFYCGDYSSIEVKVLFWMANHEKGLNAYRNKEDLYIAMASVIYDVPISEVTREQREVGKRAILGCGYGMGGAKFFDTCKKYGQEIDLKLALKSVKAYRETHAKIPEFWENLQRAAIAATRNPGKSYTINHTTWFVEGSFLWCRLPSGRKLAYFRPFVRYVDPPWVIKRRAERAKKAESFDGLITAWNEEHEKIPALHHWGVNPLTKQWTVQKTWGGVLVENVVQAVARDYMVEASLRLEAAGYENDLSIYDELLCEKADGDLEEFRELMAEAPEWGKEIPITVDAWTGPRYKKG